MRTIERGDVQMFELWPHRSLSRSGVMLVIGAIAAGQILVIARTATPAIWPLLIPALGTVAILIAAFTANNRAAMVRETIEISGGRLKITRSARGKEPVTVEFDPGWARLQLASDYYVEDRLTVSQSGRSMSLGEFLTPEERRALRDALAEALSAQK